jgi:alanine racemase
MDLIAIDVTAVASLKEGDWVDLDFNLEQLASESGMSQYELLTGLGRRFERYWS